MKWILFLLFLRFGIDVISQISIQSNDFVTPYDTIRYSQFIDVVDFTATGQNFVWDYSNITPVSQSLKEFKQITEIGFLVQATYGAFAPTPYQASFFYNTDDLPVNQLNQFLPVELNNLNTFVKKTNDRMTKVGYSINVNGNDVPFSSDTIETKYIFPLNFQDTFSTVGYTSVDLNPIVDLKIKQHIASSIIVDGYGQLNLPNGTFEVLRLKRDNIEIDSIYQSFNGNGTWIAPPVRVYTNYEWLALDKGDVLMAITVANANGQEQIQSAEYQDDYLGLDASLQEELLSMEIFPNPFVDEITIKSESLIEGITVFDQWNASVLQLPEVDSKNCVVDLKILPKGIYYVQIKKRTGRIFNKRIIRI